jgi:glycosyltransferase involved in cell wall biosynthesis
VHVLSQERLTKDCPLADQVAAHPRVKFFQPQQFKLERLFENKQLYPILLELDSAYGYEHVLVYSEHIFKHPRIFIMFDTRLHLYLDGQLFETPHLGDLEQLKLLWPKCASIWCSSHSVRDCALRTLQLDNSDHIISFLPLISQIATVIDLPKMSKKLKMCYMGKMNDDFLLIDLIDAFTKAKDLLNKAEFHFYGTPESSSERQKAVLKDKLQNTLGVVHHNDVSLEEARLVASQYHLGIYFRNRLFDGDLEMPEEVVYFTRAGVPCLVNESNHTLTSFYGKDYNGYLETTEDMTKRLFFYSRNRHAYEADQLLSLRVAQRYTFNSQLLKVCNVLDNKK